MGRGMGRFNRIVMCCWSGFMIIFGFLLLLMESWNSFKLLIISISAMMIIFVGLRLFRGMSMPDM